mmetsp:Transcript_163788/g.398067  ORF Transcript_163788/g.398067 Transcript_163788/m.398067 type:complete len:253 (-) Transcript_163788:709-1467(-)
MPRQLVRLHAVPPIADKITVRHNGNHTSGEACLRVVAGPDLVDVFVGPHANVRSDQDDSEVLRTQVTPSRALPVGDHVYGVELRHSSTVGVARDDDLVSLEVLVAALLLEEALEFAARGLVGNDEALGRLRACARLRIWERHFIEHEVRLPVTHGARGLPRHHANLAILPVLAEAVAGALVQGHLSVRPPRIFQGFAHDFWRQEHELFLELPLQAGPLVRGCGHSQILDAADDFEPSPAIATIGHSELVAWI